MVGTDIDLRLGDRTAEDQLHGPPLHLAREQPGGHAHGVQHVQEHHERVLISDRQQGRHAPGLHHVASEGGPDDRRKHLEKRQKRPDVRVVVNDGGHRDLHQEDDQGDPEPRGQDAKEPEPQQRQRKRRARRSAHERPPFESPARPGNRRLLIVLDEGLLQEVCGVVTRSTGNRLSHLRIASAVPW